MVGARRLETGHASHMFTRYFMASFVTTGNFSIPYRVFFCDFLNWIILWSRGNTFHEWGDLPIIFTSDEVTSENHWQIASRVTQKSLFTVTNVLFYFLHASWCPEHPIPPKQLWITDFAVVSMDSLFLFSIVTHHCWSVTSRECGTLALWRHIRRLFLHAQIGGKAIFTSE